MLHSATHAIYEKKRPIQKYVDNKTLRGQVTYTHLFAIGNLKQDILSFVTNAQNDDVDSLRGQGFDWWHNIVLLEQTTVRENDHELRHERNKHT